MNIRRVVPDISTDRMHDTREFYTGLLGFKVAMDMGWIITLVSPSNPTAQISIVRRNEPPQAASGPFEGLSIEVESVDEIHARAVERGVKITYPLTDEPWGARRFFVVDPNGVTLNLLSHKQVQS